MNLFVRLFLALMAARRASSIGLDDEAEITQKIRGRDTDGEGRLHKARYGSFSDLGILAFLTRAGVLALSRKHGWLPIVAGREIDILAPDLAGKNLVLITRLTGWDARYTFFEQDLFVDGTLTATMRTIGRVTSKTEKAPLVARVLEGLGLPADVDRDPPKGFVDALARMKAVRSG